MGKKIKWIMATTAGITAFTLNPLGTNAETSIKDLRSVPIKEIVEVKETEETLPALVYTTEMVNARVDSNLDADVRYILYANTALTKIENTENDWAKVKIEGEVLFIDNTFLTFDEPNYIEEDSYAIKILKEDDNYGEYLGEFKLTAYCSCEKCCGKWAKYGLTSSGTTPEEGRTVACNSIAAGTKIIINGHEYTVEDTGNMKDNVIDIYMASHEDACEFGVQYAEVYLLVE